MEYKQRSLNLTLNMTEIYEILIRKAVWENSVCEDRVPTWKNHNRSSESNQYSNYYITQYFNKQSID